MVNVKILIIKVIMLSNQKYHQYSKAVKRLSEVEQTLK